MANDVELLSMCFFLLYNFFDEMFLLIFCLCSNWIFLSLLGFENSFHFLDVSPSSGMWFANSSSLSVACLFILLTVFCRTELFNISIFPSIDCAFEVKPKNSLFHTRSQSVLSYALPRSFVVLYFPFNTIIYCDLVFLR